jgi:hypothetical protein
MTPVSRGRVVAAVALTMIVALAVYRATMLPGFDFGDTAAFQDTGGARPTRSITRSAGSPCTRPVASRRWA